MNFDIAEEGIRSELGVPERENVKVKAWRKGDVSLLLQIDQPNREEAAFIWLPYPEAGETVPEIAFEYAAGTGRHSGTYASRGLEKGQPVLKLIVRTSRELKETIEYFKCMASKGPLPPVIAEPAERDVELPRVENVVQTIVDPIKPRREAIPRAVQREIWQRDGGRCVECSSRERLCYDHIIPFSRGGSNSVRNLQLLCEPCNLSKGNRI